MQTVFADGGNAGPRRKGKLDKLDTPNTEFVPVSKRRVVERTLTWISSVWGLYNEKCATEQS